MSFYITLHENVSKITRHFLSDGRNYRSIFGITQNVNPRSEKCVYIQYGQNLSTAVNRGSKSV